MGAAQSAFNPDRSPQVVIPEGYQTPPWPALYVPDFDITSRQLGVFLYDASAIWRFTLYWTLLLVCGTYFVCSLIAVSNLFLSLTMYRPLPLAKVASRMQPPTPLTSLASPTPMSRRDYMQSGTADGGGHEQGEGISTATSSAAAPRLRRLTPTGPPLWPLLLIPLIAVAVSALISLISATIIGFALAALYSAGGFSMSTWVPFLWGIIVVLILIISSYSTLTSIL